MKTLDVTRKVKEFIDEEIVIQEYENILKGYSSMFAKGYWNDQEKGRRKIGIIIRHIQKNILKCDIEDMYLLSHADFKTLRLWGGLRQVYSNRFIDAVMDAYTDEEGNCPLSKHRFRMLSNKYWNAETYIGAIRYEISHKFKGITATGLKNIWGSKFVCDALDLDGAYRQLKSSMTIKETLVLAFPRNFINENGKIKVVDDNLRF